jgi:UDP-N-acetylglucosamine/UDP-N-acetylgalactosamine 4-epimerase
MRSAEQFSVILAGEPRLWLVTGAAGFIGSNLLESLLLAGQSVVGLDNFSTGCQKNLDEVRRMVGPENWKRFRLIRGDIRDLSQCRSACEDVTHVLHQAAFCSVSRSIEDPLTSAMVNVQGFLNMLTAARDAGVRRFVYASSSAVYGSQLALPKREDVIGEPLSPYAATKLSNELFATAYGRCFGIQCIGLRYFNAFGPRQDPNGAYAAVVPKWLAAVLRGEQPYIYGDGETCRDFCFIDNVVQANLRAATTNNPNAVNHTYNIAAGRRTTLNQLFKKIRAGLAARVPGLVDVEPIYRDFRAGDVRYSEADISKAAALLGYEVTHDVESGLDLTLDWYVSSLGGETIPRPQFERRVGGDPEAAGWRMAT